MKEKKPFYRTWWFWVIIIFIVLPLMFGIKNTASKESTPEPAVEASKEASQEPETTESKFTAIIDSLKFKYSDLQIYDNDSSVKISLHYDNTSWDETHFCSECLTDYINLCQQGYDIPGIDKIEYYVFVNLQDAKGNEKSEKGLAICMTKDSFNTYNWDNMKYIAGSYDQIESDCEFLDIHAGIKKNVDFNKVYYKGK